MPNLSEMLRQAKTRLASSRNGETNQTNPLRACIEKQETDIDNVVERLRQSTFAYTETEHWNANINDLIHRLSQDKTIGREIRQEIVGRLHILQRHLTSTNIWLGNTGISLDEESIALYTMYLHTEKDLLSQDNVRRADLADLFLEYKKIIARIKQLTAS